MKSTHRLGMGLLAIAAAAGLWATFMRLSQGMMLTNLTSNMAWGMWVAFYIYCIGLSAGSFLMSTLVYVFGMHRFERMGRIALLSALFALLGGLVFVWIDLGHPWRFYKVFTGWQVSSVLAWESLLYIFYIVIICAELWFLMRCDLARQRDDSHGPRRIFYSVAALGWRCPEKPEEREACHVRGMRGVTILGVIGIPIAIGVHGGTGALFAVVAAKPYWFSGLFPIIFLVSALVSGCGLMLFLYSFFGQRDEGFRDMLAGLRSFLIIFIGIDVLLFTSDLLVSNYSAIPGHTEVWRAVIFGHYWYVFWLGQLGLAWLLPVLITSLPATRGDSRWLGGAGACVVAGIVAVRLNLVIPAYLHEQLPGLADSLPDARSAYAYFPSAIEILSTAGLLSLLVLAFIAAWNLLPMFDVTRTSLTIDGNTRGEV